ncbi:HTH-type transcriptional regulator gltR [Anaerobiospirillum thomasii]|uniref:HTH-type transcriptional regulator gltR n=1 Tax=Anaerobiospirillum thomasii TaxID=179995 RepID=A0A2X0V5T7_9GAMM|nr:LysR family transcriptional regulator [Anaerobiospirillum thomasii]SPT68075.1 HTH-type transcriptional regulator gltR [Anaerobiospirillum thomasii]SPT70537.1 HTH-type transcriptional regulator gltR [Anaerobiospirillum thomasii]
MRLSVEQLQSFIAAARFGSFSQAARELQRAQSVVSTHVASLEEQLDYALFTRGHKITLTQRGQILLNHAIEIVEASDIFMQRALALHEIKNPIIHLGIDYSLYGPKLFNAIREFSNKYPDLELNISSLSSFELTSLMNEMNIDLALVFNHSRIDKFNCIDIADIDNKVVVSVDHPLYKCKEITRDTLAVHRQIVIASQYTKTQNPIELSPINWVVDNYYYAINLVAMGLGFAVVPTSVVDAEEKLAEKLDFLDDSKLNFPDSQLTLVYRDYALDFEPVQYLSKLLLSIAKNESVN